MFAIGFLILLIAFFILVAHRQMVKHENLRFDQDRKDYYELRSQGIKSEPPKFTKIKHTLFELIFVVLIILAIIFIVYPEQSLKIIWLISSFFVWFYFGPY